MNTVTINGVNSNTITGLLIQSLPPISKPQMRTQLMEIDGRAGDVITRLGYKAYDKEMSIGLHGSYDINEVIGFFAAEGEIIFSNEPDKVYRFAQLEQIDFERLIRFRTARVIFHTQPYKHSATEQAVVSSSSPVTITNTGNTDSRPSVTIEGQGTVTLAVNGNDVFTLTMDTNDTITINGEDMNAYTGGVLRNRAVQGDYDALVFAPGVNTLSWTGTVTEVTVENYSRWI